MIPQIKFYAHGLSHLAVEVTINGRTRTSIVRNKIAREALEQEGKLLQR